MKQGNFFAKAGKIPIQFFLFPFEKVICLTIPKFDGRRWRFAINLRL